MKKIDSELRKKLSNLALDNFFSVIVYPRTPQNLERIDEHSLPIRDEGENQSDYQKVSEFTTP